MKLKYISYPVLVLFGVAAVSGSADSPKGKDIYAAKCASCHGKDLKGNPAMAKVFKVDPSALNLVDKETLTKTDADLIATTTKGKGKMPAQAGKLKPEEITDLVAYIRSSDGSGGEKAK